MSPTKIPTVPVDSSVQFPFCLRKNLRKQYAQLANDQDATMRSFILDALKEKGLNVLDENMLDLRKERMGD
jgi:hypothetical protein